MRVQYFPAADSLYIEFTPGPASDSDTISEDVVADYDSAGRVIGFEILQASKNIEDVKKLQWAGVEAVPLALPA
jgi:uncharacterized protein YuzE